VKGVPAPGVATVMVGSGTDSAVVMRNRRASARDAQGGAVPGAESTVHVKTRGRAGPMVRNGAVADAVRTPTGGGEPARIAGEQSQDLRSVRACLSLRSRRTWRRRTWRLRRDASCGRWDGPTPRTSPVTW